MKIYSRLSSAAVVIGVLMAKPSSLKYGFYLNADRLGVRGAARDSLRWAYLDTIITRIEKQHLLPGFKAAGKLSLF